MENVYEGNEKFRFCITFEFQCYAYLSTCAVKKKKKERKKRKKKNGKKKKKKKKRKKRKKKNGRKKNKKKNIVHTPIGKNDAPRFILFSYVDSRITL